MVFIEKGNLFNSNCQTLVNTINCVGAMGKGLALVFKLRYPAMFDLYRSHCQKGLISPGTLWLYKRDPSYAWVLNFPTKYHWKYPSKLEYLEKGLDKFLQTYKAQGIQSIAFPLLGTDNGGLDKEEVLNLMQCYLSQCEIPVEIYEYDPSARDDLFESFKAKWEKREVAEIIIETGIRKDRIITISERLASGEVSSMIGLIESKGISLKTIEKCFAYISGVNLK